MAETTEQYRTRINQLKTSIENEPYMKNMRPDIAEGIGKTGNRQADIEVRQGALEDDFVAVQQDASSASPSGAEVAVARGGHATLDDRLTVNEEKTAQKADESQLPQVLKYLYMENEVDSSMSMIDLKNFGRTNKKIPFVIHNYTDARVMQLDNVGNNTNLQLTNAHNPTNRPDKDGNYVGTGTFIDLQEYQLATDTNESVLKLTNTGGLEWSGLKGGTVFTNGKEVSTDYLYEFRSKKVHTNLFRFGNASQYVLSFINDVPVNSIPTRTVIESSSGQTNGMLIQTRAGSINLKSFNGKTINTGSLDVTDKLAVTNDVSVGKNLQIGKTTDVDALPNSVYLDEGSTLKYKNGAGVVKTIAFAA